MKGVKRYVVAMAKISTRAPILVAHVAYVAYVAYIEGENDF